MERALMPIFQAGRTEYEKYYGTFAVDFGYECSFGLFFQFGK